MGATISASWVLNAFLALVLCTGLAYLLRRPPDHSPPQGCPPAEQLRGVSLHLVHPKDPQTESKLDIIAIHGLDTRSPDTWTFWGGEQPVNWLEHPEMLPQIADAYKARIYYCDWPADLFKSPDFTQQQIKDIANGILDVLKNRRGDPKRPILFIASCLGGIVLIQALVLASRQDPVLSKAAQGIIFLATPFRGTSFRDVVSWALPGLQTLAFLRDRSVNTILNVVSGPVQDPADIKGLVREFTSIWHDRKAIRSFYETATVSLVQRYIPFRPVYRLFPRQQLVDESSATLDIVRNPHPLDRSHVMMNKFSSPKDKDYIPVAEQIEEVLKHIQEGSPLYRADVQVRNYLKPRLTITRISGVELPMESCYINLSIVKQHQAGQRFEAQSIEDSPFSLNARLKADNPAGKAEVKLAALFEVRETLDGQNRQPSRILIRGRAGVGKTTLCKKIVHDFVQCELWQGLYDRILWIPLRNLKLEERRNTPGYNLERLFHHEFFAENHDGQILADALSTEVDCNGVRTLFILDGLDEVSHILSDRMLDFLKKLLSQTRVVITARPFAELPVGTPPIDLELETTGFKPEQVDEYIDMASIDPGTGSRHQKMVNKITEFLKGRALVQGLVRIPIMLDAFCLTWDSANNDAMSGAMTAIYRAIEKKLWKKDAVGLEKNFDGQLVTAAQLDDENIDEIIRAECQLLEEFAFAGMYNETTEFGLTDRKAMVKRVFPDGLPKNRLPGLSFLRTSDPSQGDSNRSYHFLHLTFQEYFAARYFVRHWRDNQHLNILNLEDGSYTRCAPAQFLGENKYNARYDIMWRFVTGLLDAQHGKEARDFFQALEQQPRDLLGLTHQRLIMHCLTEVPFAVSGCFAQLRTKAEAHLRDWLLFEYKLTDHSDLVREMEFPSRCLMTALHDDSDRGEKQSILRALGHHLYQGTLPEDVLLHIVALMDDDDRRVRRRALEILRRQPMLSGEGIRAIVTRLDDPCRSLRLLALESLDDQSTLSGDDISRVAAQLDDEDRGIRIAARDVLERRPAVPHEVQSRVTARLDDQDEDFCTKLVPRAPVPEAFLARYADMLGHGDWNMRKRAMQVLGTQSLPEHIRLRIAARLEDQKPDARCAAIETLCNNASTLPGEMLMQVMPRLDDDDPGVRSLAIGVLSRNCASEQVVLRIANRLEDTDPMVRWHAVEALNDQQLSEEVVLRIANHRLEDTEPYVRQAAITTLSNQQLSEEVVLRIANRLEDIDPWVCYYAVEALYDQQLSEEVVLRIANRLEDTDYQVRAAAITTLRNQQLSDEVVLRIANRLEDLEPYVRRAAITMLRNQQLSEEVVLRIANRLEDTDPMVRANAIGMLGTLSLGEENQLRLAALTEYQENTHGEEFDPWDSRRIVVQALTGQSLTPKVLLYIVKLLDAPDLQVCLETVRLLLSQPNLDAKILVGREEAFFRAVLGVSFDEPTTWHVVDGTSYISSGGRSIHLKHTQRDEVLRWSAGWSAVFRGRPEPDSRLDRFLARMREHWEEAYRPVLEELGGV